MKILYKYVAAERALTCLPEVGDGTLRATQPSALNDPFECSVGKGFTIPISEHDMTIANLLNEINPATRIDQSIVDEAREQWGSQFWQELLRKQVSYRFGIVSFASEFCNPLLWAHYTVDGSGFVIGYDRDDLSELVCDGELLKPVCYVKYRPPIEKYQELLDQNYIQELLLMKSDVWRYENEWRIVVELSHTIGTGNTDARQQPICLFRIPNKAVKEIYYTERTPSDKVDAIKSRIRNANNRYACEPVKLELSGATYDYVLRE